MVGSPSTRDPVETRDALVSSGRRLFGAAGYAATSLDAVAEGARVTKGALYHHFDSKASLFLAVYEDLKKDLARDVARAQRPSEPWGSLVAGCRRWIEVHTQPPAVQIALVDARAVLTTAQWQDVDSRWGTVVIRSALRRAMVHGVIKELPLAPLARLMQGTYNEACLLVAEAPDVEDAREAAIAVTVHVLEGLRPS